MNNQAVEMFSFDHPGGEYFNLAEALSRAIAERRIIPASALGLDHTPPTLDVRECANCKTQALTEAGLVPIAWSAPHGPDGPFFCPDCTRGHIPGAVDPCQIVPELRGTWEGAGA